METTLAILMVLGIFVGIPAIVGFTIAGVYVLAGRRFRKAQHATALGQAVAETLETHKELQRVD
jgi:flagellar biosynthesis component FlhA